MNILIPIQTKTKPSIAYVVESIDKISVREVERIMGGRWKNRLSVFDQTTC